MYKIIKIDNELYIASSDNKELYISLDGRKSETLRDLILNLVNGSFVNFSLSELALKTYKFEEIQELESIDKEYIKNRFIHYLI